MHTRFYIVLTQSSCEKMAFSSIFVHHLYDLTSLKEAQNPSRHRNTLLAWFMCGTEWPGLCGSKLSEDDPHWTTEEDQSGPESTSSRTHFEAVFAEAMEGGAKGVRWCAYIMDGVAGTKIWSLTVEVELLLPANVTFHEVEFAKGFSVLSCWGRMPLSLLFVMRVSYNGA